MGFPMIETGYKPEFALGGLYQGINAADAQAMQEQEVMKAMRESAVAPMDMMMKAEDRRMNANTLRMQAENQAMAQESMKAQRDQQIAESKKAADRTLLEAVMNQHKQYGPQSDMKEVAGFYGDLSDGGDLLGQFNDPGIKNIISRFGLDAFSNPNVLQSVGQGKLAMPEVTTNNKIASNERIVDTKGQQALEQIDRKGQWTLQALRQKASDSAKAAVSKPSKESWQNAAVAYERAANKAKDDGDMDLYEINMKRANEMEKKAKDLAVAIVRQKAEEGRTAWNDIMAPRGGRKDAPTQPQQQPKAKSGNTFTVTPD